MKFEFYVPNYNFNKRKVEMFNIFQNIHVQECTEKEVKKYLRSPAKYKYIKNHLNTEEDIYYGFEAFVMEIDSIIRWQEWGRREYETCISDAFTYEICDLVEEFNQYESLDDLKSYLDKINVRNSKLEKWFCYY